MKINFRPSVGQWQPHAIIYASTFSEIVAWLQFHCITPKYRVFF